MHLGGVVHPTGTAVARFEVAHAAVISGKKPRFVGRIDKRIGKTVPAELNHFVPSELESGDCSEVFVSKIRVPHTGIISVQADRNAEAKILDEGMLQKIRRVFE